MVCRRNLYGAPPAGRNFMKTRDAFLLNTFNKNGWSCKKSIRDPSLFMLTKDGKKTWLLCIFDDIDCASECKEHAHEIFDTMHKEWPCKQVDVSFMLGVRRTLTESNNVRTMTMSMEQYV